MSVWFSARLVASGSIVQIEAEATSTLVSSLGMCSFPSLIQLSDGSFLLAFLANMSRGYEVCLTSSADRLNWNPARVLTNISYALRSNES